MTVPLYPYGYARPPDGGPQGMGTMLSWEAMLTKDTVNRLHPEVLRRFHALIDAAWTAGVPLGVGTGWRVQPDPPPAGFAQPGNSWHESCPVSPSSSTALAIDTVPNVSWDWMQINSGRFGLRSFRYVNNEPWHVQPVEISTSRKHATVMPALVTWELPGEPEPAPAPTVTFTLAGIHDEGDPMFIASKDGKYWIGNGLGRRVCADNADADFLIEKFKFASTPLINFQSGKTVTARDQVTGVPQMDRLGVNVEP